eukprot:TRINITY_DN2207_c0_g3_i1.p1 TRINITY_DN2207_c0_g3~~TRINITY_DN2207_c0_g3_i1.p1  ORF type:complete len:158 (-),score=25.95 TRINITY_DN2207_c0_g3_i1:168-641(-)
MTKATIMLIKHDENTPLFYLSCPIEECKKKVVLDEQLNTWHCAKCLKNYTTCNARYILSMRIADNTVSEWATAFNDSGVTIMGMDANTLKQRRESQDPTLEFQFALATFVRYNFKIKAHEEMYQDEQRIKLTIQSAHPIDYVEESRLLIQKISQFSM